MKPEKQQVKPPESQNKTFVVEVSSFGSRESASNFAQFLSEYAINKNLKIEIKELEK
jgi:hypothetical protein